MNVDAWQMQVLFAVLGGAAAEMLHWRELFRNGKIKKYRSDPFYWVITVGLIAIGGIMPILYVNGTVPALLCFHLGASAPLILQKLTTTTPAAEAHLGDDDKSIRDFFKW